MICLEIGLYLFFGPALIGEILTVQADEKVPSIFKKVKFMIQHHVQLIGMMQWLIRPLNA